MNINKLIATFLFLTICAINTVLLSQQIVEFTNSDFNGEAKKGISFGKPLVEWSNMSSLLFPEETSYDIQPGFWNVSTKPKFGATYIGMVTRQNGSYESIGQKLSKPLEKNTEYMFSIHVSTSPDYESKTRENLDEISKFDNPALFRVIGKKIKSNDYELLYESVPITNINWKKLEIAFTPSIELDLIILEAYHVDKDKPQNGNILIDAINLDLENVFNHYPEYELIDFIVNNQECSFESKLLKPIYDVKSLHDGTSTFTTYLVGLTPKEKLSISKSLEIINASEHSRSITEHTDNPEIIAAYQKAELNQSLYPLLLKYTAINRDAIIEELKSYYR